MGGRTGKQTPEIRQTVSQLGHRRGGSGNVCKLAEIFCLGPGLQTGISPRRTDLGLDRVGYKEFVKHIFEGVEFNPEAKVADDIYWADKRAAEQSPCHASSQHKHAGPQEKSMK